MADRGFSFTTLRHKQQNVQDDTRIIVIILFIVVVIYYISLNFVYKFRDFSVHKTQVQL